jgi:hypothetical protein
MIAKPQKHKKQPQNGFLAVELSTVKGSIGWMLHRDGEFMVVYIHICCGYYHIISVGHDCGTFAQLERVK